MRKILIILSIFFVLFSFSPSLFEIYHLKDLPAARTFDLVHNYLFDYNFYLSRIREGQEGRWLVVEKYYNQPHAGSLFQIFYLYLGKIGGIFRLSPDVIYHAARLLIGLILLILIGKLTLYLFPPVWALVAFLLIVTASSWPILVSAGNFWRFATYMGWWSAADSLQRITFIPHVLLGQIFILSFIWRFSQDFKSPRLLKLLMWGIVGLIIGIIFPPTLVVVYTALAILSVLELIFGSAQVRSLLVKRIIPRTIFILVSLPSFLYLQLMFKVLPWSALALFDVQHRMPLPYKEYALSLGPVLLVGVAGLVIALVKAEKKLLPVVAWMIAVGSLFVIFEKVPQQSPLRFTEAMIHVPLGILSTYLFYLLWQISHKHTLPLRHVGVWAIRFVLLTIILMGLGVMVSMVGWLTDQATAKRVGTWIVPTGSQLIYPLKDFMDGVYFLRDHSKKEEVVLAFVTAGNYIPAYAGNFVYLGHANTPEENEKEKIAAVFFVGKMGEEEAKKFLGNGRISYVYFGPQERELGGVNTLEKYYPFLISVYKNSQVTIYRIGESIASSPFFERSFSP